MQVIHFIEYSSVHKIYFILSFLKNLVTWVTNDHRDNQRVIYVSENTKIYTNMRSIGMSNGVLTIANY